ncbi:MAG: GNAT family N-acetyltransferase [Selenomonas sp.]|uniref:GNAT family N-acetyltransferase n=1 Tax=Selenomonas sp. TaxID=2053611 RepID=UPI0025D5B750|nr:GNAT family N-acetyltransferase [Selenomonas sp.]MCR5758401.1 GNAT family N-acetyltransferase [Selenomonas sp.]
MTIVKAHTCDIQELYALQLLSFESSAQLVGSRALPALMETLEEIERDFEQWTVLKMMNEAGEIIGAIRYRLLHDVVELGRLMIHPEYRAQGRAKRLLMAVEEEHPDKIKELYTCTKNWLNIQLYDKMGYRPTKEVEHPSGLSFVYMRKHRDSNIDARCEPALVD